MAQSDLSFDDILKGPSPRRGDTRTPTHRRLEDGYVSSWLTGVLCALALFTALIASISLVLSIRDDEAELIIGFGSFTVWVAVVLWLLAATSAFFVASTHRRSTVAVVLVIGGLGAAALFWALTSVAEAATYVP